MKTKPFQFFNLISQGNSGNFVKLLKHQLQYLGPEDLTQYFVKSFNISDDDEYVKSVTNGKTGVRVDFIFSRRLLNQILTTFMPTVRKLTIIWNKIINKHSPFQIFICMVSFTTSFYKVSEIYLNFHSLN